MTVFGMLPQHFAERMSVFDCAQKLFYIVFPVKAGSKIVAHKLIDIRTCIALFYDKRKAAYNVFS